MRRCLKSHYLLTFMFTVAQSQNLQSTPITHCTSSIHIMSLFSRIFKHAARVAVPWTFAVSIVKPAESSEDQDDEDCETPICHDAGEAIKEYGQFFSRRTSSNRRGSRFMAEAPDRQQLGRHSWTLLHAMAAYWPQNPSVEQQENVIEFFRLLSELYPCKVCAADLKDELEQYPPRVGSREEFIKWLCELHNHINRKIGKTQFDCTQHQRRWRRDHNYSVHDIEELEEEGPVEYDDDD